MCIRDRDEGGRHAGNHRAAGGNQLLDLRQIIPDHLGVLRAVDKALAAEDALVCDDVSLVVRKTDALDRTVTDTFVTVFAVGLFESEKIAHNSDSPLPVLFDLVTAVF